jgi:anti-sigma-K factor RskA
VRFEVKNKGKVTASVVWSDEQQQGYLEISGLPLNDPKQKQYQLWVIDESRGLNSKPISAGVFDVKPDGTTLVRVDASLRFGASKALFAISEEPPGGLAQPTHVVLAIPPKKA